MDGPWQKEIKRDAGPNRGGKGILTFRHEEKGTNCPRGGGEKMRRHAD